MLRTTHFMADHGGAQATFGVAQGGCYFNSTAVAAVAAIEAGAERVMILDWDVHHGHGTQELFEDDPSVLYVSMHRADDDFYPHSGAVEEVGTGPGQGFTVNIPWQNNAVGDAEYIQAMLHLVLPVAYEYGPDVILVTAGFSAAHQDPTGSCTVTPSAFAHMTGLLRGIAPVGLLLEGGANLSVSAECAEACVKVLLGERPPNLDGTWGLSKAGQVAIMNCMQIHSRYWDSLQLLSLNGWMATIRSQQEAAEADARRDRALALARVTGWDAPDSDGSGGEESGGSGADEDEGEPGLDLAALQALRDLQQLDAEARGTGVATATAGDRDGGL